MNDTRRHRAARAALSLALAGFASAAVALPTCYTVYNRGGDIVYRDTVVPFDGAQDPTSAGRQALRARGEHLVFFDAEFCAPVSSVGGIGGRAYSTEEVVAGFPGYAVRTEGMSTWSRTGGSVPASASSSAGSFAGPAGRVTAPATEAIQMRTGSYR